MSQYMTRQLDGIHGVPIGLLLLSANVRNAIPKESQIPPDCLIRKVCSRRPLPPSVHIRNDMINLLHGDSITTEYLTQELIYACV